MKTIFIKNKALSAAFVLLNLTSQVFAESTAGTNEPLVLQKIMQDMGKNMQLITDGISREDWKLVSKNAQLIADHPQPPVSEKTKIMAFVGTEMGQFKSHDEKTHGAAHKLSETAKQDDGQAIIADFSTLQNTCLSCHKKFRNAFQAHFYGQD